MSKTKIEHVGTPSFAADPDPTAGVPSRDDMIGQTRAARAKRIPRRPPDVALFSRLATARLSRQAMTAEETATVTAAYRSATEALAILRLIEQAMASSNISTALQGAARLLDDATTGLDAIC